MADHEIIQLNTDPVGIRHTIIFRATSEALRKCLGNASETGARASETRYNSLSRPGGCIRKTIECRGWC